MSFEAKLLYPTGDNLQPDLVGLYAMPINSGVHNTGDRIQTMVDRIGVPFYISDLFMQNRKKIFDMAAREANQPTESKFAGLSQDRMDFFQTLLDHEGWQDHATIGMGDSLGVPAIQGMQLYASDESLFDALLLRDGWNLGPSESKVRGVSKYTAYTIRDEIQKRIRNNNFEINGYGFDDTPYDNETNLFQKLGNVADIMRSFRNKTDALHLARHASHMGYVMNIVLLRQGLSGTVKQQAHFVDELLRGALDISEENDLAAVRAEIVDGWHSDLLDPARGVKDVVNTIELLKPQDY